jgi:hypothetical protein
MSRKLYVWAVVLCGVLPHASLAYAQTADAEADISGLANKLLDAVTKSEWRYAASVALILAMMLMRPRIVKKLPFLDSHLGGIFLNVAASVLGAVSTAFVAHRAIDAELITSAVGVAVTAAGGWHAFLKPMMGSVKKSEPPTPSSEAPSAKN